MTAYPAITVTSANEVNEILTQLNNCASKGIFVLATTNRPDMIDAACLRAGTVGKCYIRLHLRRHQLRREGDGPQLYQELKDKMEHRDKENKSRERAGFSTNT